MGSFGNICRLCCTENTVLVGIFSSLNFDLKERINKLFNLEIVEGDPLPQNICEECITSVDKFERYYLLCNKAQKMLNEVQEEFVLSQEKLKLKENLMVAQAGEAVAAVNEDNIIESLLMQEQQIAKSSYKRARRSIRKPTRPLRRNRRSKEFININEIGSDQKPRFPVKMEPHDQVTVVMEPLEKSADEDLCRAAELSDFSDHLSPSMGAPEGGKERMAFEGSREEDPSVQEPIVKIEESNNSQHLEEDSDGDCDIYAEIDSDFDDDDDDEKMDPDMEAITHVARCSLCETPFYALSSLLLHHRMQHSQVNSYLQILQLFFKDLVYLKYFRIEYSDIVHVTKSDIFFF